MNIDCSLRDIPTLRILTKPEPGIAINKEMEDFSSFSSGLGANMCAKTKFRGVSLDYIANGDHAGPGSLSYEVIYSNGLDQTYTINLTVK